MSVFNRFKKLLPHRKKKTNKLDQDNEHLTADETVSTGNTTECNINLLSEETDCESANNDLSSKGVSTRNNKAKELTTRRNINARPKVNNDPGHYSNNLSEETFKRIESRLLALNCETVSDGTENRLPLKETNINTLSANKQICENAERELNTICVHAPHQWQLQDVITEKGGFFQTKHSDVRLTIQQNSVDINTTISGSVLLDIPFLRSKFKLQKTVIIVAPTVEYHLHEVTHLKLHACLELPHCMGSRNVHKMQVSWCENVRGNVTKNSISFIEKPAQEIQRIPDIFWTKGTRRNTINLFAKHFCVILCTACKEDVEFDIRALLFHKFGDINPLTLRLQLHLGGPLSKIRDFEQATIEEMKRKDMIFIEETDLNLIPRIQGTLRFHLELLELGNGNWEHVKRRENMNPVYAIQQNIDVRRLAKCGNEHVINDGVKWLLKRVTVSTNTCCFCTDIIHDAPVSNVESEATATTTMHAELPVPEERQRIRVTQVQYNQDCPERRIIKRLMVGLHGQHISRSRELFEAFGIPFHEESATREDREEYWQREFGELLRIRGLDNFLSELGILLPRLEEPELLREIRTCLPHHHYGNALGKYTTSGLRTDSNLPSIQPPNDSLNIFYCTNIQTD